MVIFRRVLIAAIILIGTFGVLALYYPDLRPQAPPSGHSVGTVTIGGPFDLLDGKGNAFTDAQLKGRYSLIFFGFTHCPDICPLTLQVMSQALDLAGPAAEQVTPVFISVDPERDTPDLVGSYVEAFDPRIVGLTGAPEQVAQAMSSYKVFAQKAPLLDADGKDTGDYTVQHSTMIYFMGPDGQYVTHFTNGTAAEDIAAYIRREVAK